MVILFTDEIYLLTNDLLFSKGKIHPKSVINVEDAGYKIAEFRNKSNGALMKGKLAGIIAESNVNYFEEEYNSFFIHFSVAISSLSLLNFFKHTSCFNEKGFSILNKKWFE